MRNITFQRIVTLYEPLKNSLLRIALSPPDTLDMDCLTSLSYSSYMRSTNIITGSSLKTALDDYTSKGVNNFGVLDAVLPDMDTDAINRMFAFLKVSISATEFFVH